MPFFRTLKELQLASLALVALSFIQTTAAQPFADQYGQREQDLYNDDTWTTDKPTGDENAYAQHRAARDTEAKHSSHLDLFVAKYRILSIFQPAYTGPNVSWASAPDAVIAEPNATSSADGAVNTTLYYVPSSSDPAGYAPDTVTDDINAYSTITASFDSQPSNTDFQSKSQCNNGFNDPCIFGSGNGTTLATGDHVETLTSQGNHIQTYSVNKSFGTINSMPYTGIVQIPTINTSLTGDVDRPAGLVYLYQTACESEIGVSPDSRIVLISSLGAQTYHKQNSSLLDPDGDPYVTRAPNGFDSRGAYHSDIGIADVHQVHGVRGTYISAPPNTFEVDYHANIYGPWDFDGLTYAWYDAATGNGQDQDGVEDFRETYVGAEVSFDGKTLVDTGDTSDEANMGNGKHIHLTVTDGGDGAVETGNYYLRVHRAVEILPSNRIPTRLDYSVNCEFELLPAPINTPINGNAPLDDFAFDYYDWIYGGVGDVSTVLSSIPHVGWVSLAASLFSVVSYDLAPKEGTSSLDWIQVWNDNANHPDTPCYSTFEDKLGRPMPVPPTDTEGDYLLEPKAMGAYQPHWELVDTYDAAGFTGESKKFLANYVQITYVYGVFHKWTAD